MWAWIIFAVIALAAISNYLIASALLHRKNCTLLTRINPVQENGEYLYDSAKMCRSAGWMVLLNAVIQTVTALSFLLVQICHLLPETLLMVAFYLMGATIVLSLTFHALYMDTYCRHQGE